jgi:hypothetical protein
MKLKWTKERDARFWDKVYIEEDEDCWLWFAAITSSGYGAFSYSKGKLISAHKVSWAIHKNNDTLSPRNLQIMHLCDNKVCVNPQHLAMGTARQNNLDAFKRGLNTPINKIVGRPSKNPYCKHGHERSKENTIIKDGYKLCKPCRQETYRKSKLKKHPSP